MLGHVLQQGRMIKGISQRELARRLGVGQKWIWEMEQGKPGLLMERLFAIMRETGVELSAQLDTPGDDRAAGSPDPGR
jgi:transcriptional regulator with XRE-family HTH domain